MNLEKLLTTAAVLSERQNIEWENCTENHLAIARKRVILMRMVARKMVSVYNAKSDELKTCNRIKNTMQSKLNAEKIAFPLLDLKIKQCEDAVKRNREHISGFGEFLINALDLWQSCGATLKDLCNLCNQRYEEVLKQIAPEHHNDSFSEIISVYHLDYNYKGDWLEYENDAPLTHAIKEHMLDILLHTAQGKQAAHNALEACFPDIMEGAIHQSTDYDGNPVWRDKSGEIVAEFEE